MDFALIALGFGLVYFAIQVPLDRTKSTLQRRMGALVVFFGVAVFLALSVLQ